MSPVAIARPGLMDGKTLAVAWRHALAEVVVSWTRAEGRAPGLAVVRVGDDPASAVYVRQKTLAAREAGFEVADVVLPESATQDQMLATLRDLGTRSDLDGLMLQLPVPGHLDTDALLEAIPPERDVDGLGVWQAGRLALGAPDLRPCTPAGIMALLHAHGVALAGSRALVIGRSRIVGRPMAQLLLGADATVTVAHSRSRDLAERVAEADVVVVAAGRPGFLSGEVFAPGAVVIDVGIHPKPGGGLLGDVDWGGEAPDVAAWTPVPGGVGPMTVTMLLVNTWQAHGRREGHPPLAEPVPA